MASKSSQTRAGKLLTKYLRQISEEETEFIKGVDEKDDRIATKAEALAHIMWDTALGKSYDSGEKDEDGKKVMLARRPDKGMMALIYDRLEGKSPISVGEGDEAITAAEKVTEQGINRIKQAGERINKSGNRTT